MKRKKKGPDALTFYRKDEKTLPQIQGDKCMLEKTDNKETLVGCFWCTSKYLFSCFGTWRNEVKLIQIVVIGKRCL